MSGGTDRKTSVLDWTAGRALRGLGRTLGLGLVLLGVSLAAPPSSWAVSSPKPLSVGGYFRIMARPDLQGGDGRLGYWNLYGRLLNEGPWAALELRLRLLDAPPGSYEPWTRIHLRIEGGGVRNAEASDGALAEFRLAQLYVQAGNLGIPGLTWQLGTQEFWFGDLGLYDMRPAQIFHHMLGLSGRWTRGPWELLVGLGDSGFGMKGAEYSPVLTGGAALRLNLFGHLDIGVGGELRFEPPVEGNRRAPHRTPGLDYHDWVQGEVLSTFLDANPGALTEFPKPVATHALSGKVIAGLGLGGWGPFQWNSFYFSLEHLHPENAATEEADGEEKTFYVQELSDDRWAVVLGNELQLALAPERLDLIWAVLYGRHWDDDNRIVPADHDREYLSTVLRLQVYPTRVLHVLVEGSAAREVSFNGNQWRNHGDSIFESTDGLADSQGLEFGDADQRVTIQGKAGVVLNPLGPGIYVRPSLRILYGIQYSTANNAFGNSYVETLDQFSDFGAYETHIHHVIALEAEAWF